MRTLSTALITLTLIGGTAVEAAPRARVAPLLQASRLRGAAAKHLNTAFGRQDFARNAVHPGSIQLGRIRMHRAPSWLDLSATFTAKLDGAKLTGTVWTSAVSWATGVDRLRIVSAKAPVKRAAKTSSKRASRK